MANNFWQNKTVLITGYEGFLGSHIAKKLLNRNAKVVGFDKVRNQSLSLSGDLRDNIIWVKGDIANLASVKQAIEKYKPEIVFHLAAETIVGTALKKPIAAFKSNIEGTWNILEVCRGKKIVKAIIVASSDKAYGNHDVLPYKEDCGLKGDAPYDVSKSCADLLSYAYFRTYCLPVCTTRCGNIYGPGDPHFSRIVPDAIYSAIRDKKLLIRSDGKFIRDYIYVEDAVDGYILLAEKMQKLRLFGESFNLSNDKPISVLELVKKIYCIAGKKPDYRILDKAENEIRRQYLSSKKARSLLGWRPRYTLEKGLEVTLEWYKGYFKIRHNRQNKD